MWSFRGLFLFASGNVTKVSGLEPVPVPPPPARLCRPLLAAESRELGAGRGAGLRGGGPERRCGARRAPRKGWRDGLRCVGTFEPLPSNERAKTTREGIRSTPKLCQVSQCPSPPHVRRGIFRQRASARTVCVGKQRFSDEYRMSLVTSG